MGNKLDSHIKMIELDIAAIKNSNIEPAIKEHIIDILNHSVVILDKKKIISDDLESLSQRMTSGNVSHCQGTLRTIANTIKIIL